MFLAAGCSHYVLLTVAVLYFLLQIKTFGVCAKLKDRKYVFNKELENFRNLFLKDPKPKYFTGEPLKCTLRLKNAEYSDGTFLSAYYYFKNDGNYSQTKSLNYIGLIPTLVNILIKALIIENRKDANNVLDEVKATDLTNMVLKGKNSVQMRSVGKASKTAQTITNKSKRATISASSKLTEPEETELGKFKRLSQAKLENFNNSLASPSKRVTKLTEEQLKNRTNYINKLVQEKQLKEQIDGNYSAEKIIKFNEIHPGADDPDLAKREYTSRGSVTKSYKSSTKASTGKSSGGRKSVKKEERDKLAQEGNNGPLWDNEPIPSQKGKVYKSYKEFIQGTEEDYKEKKSVMDDIRNYQRISTGKNSGKLIGYKFPVIGGLAGKNKLHLFARYLASDKEEKLKVINRFLYTNKQISVSAAVKIMMIIILKNFPGFDQGVFESDASASAPRTSAFVPEIKEAVKKLSEELESLPGNK